MNGTPHLKDDDLLHLLSRGLEHPHLSACPICQVRSRELLDTMRRWPLPEDDPPPSVWHHVAAAVRPRRRLRIALAAASLLAVVLLAGATFTMSPLGGGQVQRLEGTRRAPQAAARLLPTVDGALFVAWGLPPPGPGQVYELWAIRGSRHLRAAVFRPDSAGRAVVAIPSSLLAASYGVTLEKAPGAAQPSGRRVLHE